jgi:hypothetical protein
MACGWQWHLVLLSGLGGIQRLEQLGIEILTKIFSD